VIVMKFGGSSVADADRIRAAVDIVVRREERRPVVVVSALGGVTDLLERAFAAARQDDREGLEAVLADVERRHRWALSGCVDEPGRRHHLGLEIDRLFEQLRQRLRSVRVLAEGTPRIRDAVLAHGEALSARILTAALQEGGLAAHRMDPEQIMATDDRFGAASPDVAGVRERCRTGLVPLLEAREVPVLGGFVGSSPAGETTTLGRGGSDTSAAALGLALEADEIQIWTDVDGLMSADPHLVPEARTLDRVSFAEAAELALYGARVLHPDSIAPAVRRGVPVRVLNSMRPEGRGTLVVGERPADDAGGPVAVASKDGIGVARVLSRRMPMDPALPRRVLSVCADAGVVPELVLSSATTMSIVTSRPERLRALAEVGDEAEIRVSGDCAIACVVGLAGTGAASLLERVIAEVARGEPELIASGALRASVIAVVRRGALARTVRRLHERFFEGGSVS
jgi:aspartate kinase